MIPFQAIGVIVKGHIRKRFDWYMPIALIVSRVPSKLT